MIKNHESQAAELPLEELAKYNERIFFDATIPTDEFSPLKQPQANHISPAELTGVLEHKF
jgi:hypothetical protein